MSIYFLLKYFELPQDAHQISFTDARSQLGNHKNLNHFLLFFLAKMLFKFPPATIYFFYDAH
jgi:hypothetical protein